MLLIILEKVYNIDLKMIDDLAEVKQCLETCFQKLNEVEDFYDISYDFEIETSKTEEEFYQKLGKLMDLAKESLIIKRKTVESHWKMV